jgi:hypothetical protein
MFGGYASFKKVAMLLGLCVENSGLSANMVAHNKIKRKEKGCGHVTLTRCYSFCCDPFDLGVIAHVRNLK